MKCENCNKLLGKVKRVTAKVGLLAMHNIEKQIAIDKITMDTLTFIVDELKTDDLDKEKE